MPDEIDVDFEDFEEDEPDQFGLEEIEQEDAEAERQAELAMRRAEHDLKRRQEAAERRRKRLIRIGRQPGNLEELMPSPVGDGAAGEEGGGEQGAEGIVEVLGEIKELLERQNEILEEMKEARQAGVFGP